MSKADTPPQSEPALSTRADTPNAVFSGAYSPATAPKSEDLEAVNAALNEAAAAGPSTEAHPMVKPHAPMGAPTPAVAAKKLLAVPDGLKEEGNFFGARSPALKTFDAAHPGPKTESIPGSGVATPSRVFGIGGKVPKPDYSEDKIVVAMVGLPARGKSYLSNKLMRYLTWLEYSVKVFNVGNLRRTKAKQRQEKEGVKEDHTASYFSHSNQTANESREKIAEESLEMLIDWLKTKGGNVGIHDATNSTRDRRAKIQARVAREPGLKVLFLESMCDDPSVIASNVELKVSMGDPDYAGMSREDARADFLRRIKQYEASYEPVAGGEGKDAEEEFSYIKILNVGAQVAANRIEGYLQSRIAYYLMNLHLRPRSIYFSRHGESQFNVSGRIGGDAPLSPAGRQYAAHLPELVHDIVQDAPLTVWTSTLARTIETAAGLPYNKLTWKSLDELDAGVCDGMTYEEIEEAYPEDFNARDEDKFNYRYRGGESYRDIVVRLEPVIMELERQENIMIVCHQAVLRCLYAYFHNLSQSDLPYIKIPLHTVIKLTPKAYGCDEERFKVPIEAVDTHRPKPVKKDSGVMDVVMDDAEKETHTDPDGVLSNAPPTRTFFTEEEKGA